MQDANNCDEDNDKHTGDDYANYNNNTVSDLGGMNSQRAAILGSCHLDRGVPCHIACVQIGIPHWEISTSKQALHNRQEIHKRKWMYLLYSPHWWSKTQQSQLVAIAVASMLWQRFEEIVDDRSGYILRTPESDFGVFVKYFKLASS